VVKTIAIFSIDPGDVGYREDIRAIYYNRLSQCLKDAGYEVVPRWAVDHAFEDASEQAGGTFDPFTGARLESKMTQVAQTQIRELEERNHVDALLYVSFPTSRAPFDSKGSVEWDGLTRSAFSAGAHIDSSAHIQGFARTLSFSVRLTDLNNNVLYTKRIGADLLSLFNGIYFLEASRTKIQLDEGRALELAKSALSELTE
jgi:hypothetical protein